MLPTPSRNIFHFLSTATITSFTFTRGTIASTRISKCKSKKSESNENSFHKIEILINIKAKLTNRDEISNRLCVFQERKEQIKMRRLSSKVQKFKLISNQKGDKYKYRTKGKYLLMSLIIHIQQLIDTLFSNPTFQSKLRLFTQLENADESLTKLSKSMHTDVSLQDSQSKLNLDVQYVTSQIEQLLTDICSRGQRIAKFDPHGIELCTIMDQIQNIRKQVAAVQQINCELKIQMDKIKGIQENLKNQCVSMKQYKFWEQQILQKIDIAMNRNYKKIESIFADKLNTFKMNIDLKIGSMKQIESEKITSFEKIGESSIIQPEQGDVSKQIGKCKTPGNGQTQLIKKLKSAKSLGSLFGFKS